MSLLEGGVVSPNKMFLHYSQENFERNYDDDYVLSQVIKFLNRRRNHWKSRIKTSFDLIEGLDLRGRNVLDLGTSVGTYAFEFASRGFFVSGIDLNPKAIRMAMLLNDAFGFNIDFRVGDIADPSHFAKDRFDLIYGGDIIEHLPPPILEETLNNCFAWLKEGGYFVYHTVPMKYDILFHKSPMWILLTPFFFLPERPFKWLVHEVYAFWNLLYGVFKGKSYEGEVGKTVHCNLQTSDSFLKILRESGFISVDNFVCITEERFRRGMKHVLFRRHEYFMKDMFGIAWKPCVGAPKL